MGATRPAFGKICNFYLTEFVFLFFLYPDARRVAPIRGSVFLQRVSDNIKCPQNALALDAYFDDKLFMLWSFTKKQYITILTDRTDCTDTFAHATCFSTTEMTDFTDFVSIACSLRH